MDGWGQFGAALGGNSNAAYQQGAVQGARLETLLLEARKARDAEVGRQVAAKEAYDAGNSELANAILRGSDPRQLSGYNLDRQKLGFGEEAMGVARQPDADVGELNRMLMVMSGKPFAPTHVQGNTILSTIDPAIAPQTTELGQAMIGTENAHAGAYGAQANASNALADKRRGGGGGAAHAGGFATEKPTALNSTELEALFSRVDPDTGMRTFDKDEYRRFLEFQRKRGIPNAQRAAQEFSTDFSNVAGGAPDLPPPEPDEEPGLLDRLSGAFSGGTPETFDPSAFQNQKSAADAARPTSQAEFDSLPAGTVFVNPADGRIMRKK